MEEKRKDLDAEKRLRLLQGMVDELSKTHTNLYYQTTSEVALILKSQIEKGAGLTVDEKALLSPLSHRDIQILLSHQN
ncbi:MAG: hypothetical protein AAGC95_07205 [Pseudomonadota bacterium]